MKKTTITLIALLATEICFTQGFTSGSYKGNGLWNSKKAKGIYQTSTVIDRSVIEAHYTLPGGGGFDLQLLMGYKNPI